MVRGRTRMLSGAVLIVLIGLCSCNRNTQQAGNNVNSPNQAATAQPASTNQSSDGASANTATSAGSSTAAANANAPAPVSAPNAPQQTSQPLTIPAGTAVTVRLQQRLSSASSSPGERFEATIDEPVVVQDQIVIPVGATVYGHVVSARHSGRLHHPGEIALTLDSVVVGQQTIPLGTSEVFAYGRSHKKRNWGWIGGGTGGGALIGALAGGGKGALIGGGIGAAAGTTTALLTGKKDVGFGVERRLRFRLRQDVTLAG